MSEAMSVRGYLIATLIVLLLGVNDLASLSTFFLIIEFVLFSFKLVCMITGFFDLELWLTYLEFLDL